MSIVIKAENLGKKYIIAHQQQQNYVALRDVIANTAKRWGQKVIHSGRAKQANPAREEFWALKDVSFEINQGDRVGIIGRNGAGKSTLLKVLSRITEPTTGRVSLKGRVASLLEVGTGFHPELTGRENIYLNGAILGMSRIEIKRKFDEIVAFAEVEKFLDTPVKRYSSGMYVRLAFAVAAHLEPEILVVDEVLAVGDAQFQKKCLGKMEQVGKEGRTVLFVSHNMGMITTLCSKGLLLNQGKIAQSGQVSEVVNQYVGLAGQDANLGLAEYAEDPALPAQILSASIVDANSQVTSNFDVFDRIKFESVYLIRKPIAGMAFNLVVERNGEILFVSFDTDRKPSLLGNRDTGLYKTSVYLPSPLKMGRYNIHISLSKPGLDGIDVKRDALSFDVEERSFDTSMCSYSSLRPGVIAADLEWSVQKRQ